MDDAARQVVLGEVVRMSVVLTRNPSTSISVVRGLERLKSEVNRRLHAAPDPAAAQTAAGVPPPTAAAPLDARLLVAPFAEIIRSKDTSGPFTGAALSAVRTFLTSGVLGGASEAAAVAAVAESVTRCRFEATDTASDEVVVALILEVAVLLVESGTGPVLSDETVWQIFKTCFGIAREERHSQLLRASALRAAHHVVRRVFQQLPRVLAADADASALTFAASTPASSDADDADGSEGGGDG
eukprot:CAMPEP_0203814442 /NCGR_PEP_ID=MMETSP0115-20131106/5289_1 /ASSEMBLY_ACC=CAM_ASM_000227 /TAXON_ID=33651 /ORGANISM="Bicosoecid sp, Strain ms1" /LENGTH=241 /DNA_ID=CAMNT_0050723321 /DNA_START=179 /DNA_END=901 /DNA_ORIENTATION=-